MSPRRGPNPRRGNRPRLQWYGGFSSAEVLTVASTGVGGITQLRPAHGSLDADRSVVIKRIILSMSVRRVLISAIDCAMWAVSVGQTDSSGNPTDVLELLDTDPFVMANKALLQVGSLPVPPIIYSTTREVDRSVVVVDYDFKVNRRVDLAREAILMQLNADVSGVITVCTNWRMLVQTS